MPSAVAFLTYQRQEVLQKALESAVKHLPSDIPLAVFDDGSATDNTVAWLKSLPNLEPNGHKNLLSQIECEGFSVELNGRKIWVFAAYENLGVAANSNRAIRWFELATIGYDHLFLANDDIIFYGDAVTAYAEAHKQLDIGLLCLNRLKDDSHRWQTTPLRGYKVKLFQRMTGAVMSMTRDVISAIGYFDPIFGKAGNEHCDYTNRARLKGFMQVLNKPQVCIDIDLDPPLVDHQHDTESSISAIERDACDHQAETAMQQKMVDYKLGRVFETFQLRHLEFAGNHAAFDAGLSVDQLTGYAKVVAIPPPPE